MDALIKNLPTLFLIGFLVFMLVRFNRSMRLQKEAVDRQKDGMNRVDESLTLSKESVAIAKSCDETNRQILEELRQIKGILAKNENK